MSSQLSGLSYVVLALIGRDGAGPYDLVQMAHRGQRLFYSGAASKIYAQPKRLEQLGYLSSEKTPGKTRPRTHYRLTAKGLAALKAWLAQPSSFARVQNEAAIRVMASDLADDPEDVINSLRALRHEISELEALLTQAEHGAHAAIPHRQQQLRLLRSLGRRILHAHLDWIDEVEHELGSKPAQLGPRAASPRPRSG